MHRSPPHPWLSSIPLVRDLLPPQPDKEPALTGLHFLLWVLIVWIVTQEMSFLALWTGDTGRFTAAVEGYNPVRSVSDGFAVAVYRKMELFRSYTFGSLALTACLLTYISRRLAHGYLAIPLIVIFAFPTLLNVRHIGKEGAALMVGLGAIVLLRLIPSERLANFAIAGLFVGVSDIFRGYYALYGAGLVMLTLFGLKRTLILGAIGIQALWLKPEVASALSYMRRSIYLQTEEQDARSLLFRVDLSPEPLDVIVNYGLSVAQLLAAAPLSLHPKDFVYQIFVVLIGLIIIRAYQVGLHQRTYLFIASFLTISIFVPDFGTALRHICIMAMIMLGMLAVPAKRRPAPKPARRGQPARLVVQNAS